jgi:hypothetical protein
MLCEVTVPPIGRRQALTDSAGTPGAPSHDDLARGPLVTGLTRRWIGPPIRPADVHHASRSHVRIRGQTSALSEPSIEPCWLLPDQDVPKVIGCPSLPGLPEAPQRFGLAAMASLQWIAWYTVCPISSMLWPVIANLTGSDRFCHNGAKSQSRNGEPNARCTNIPPMGEAAPPRGGGSSGSPHARGR